MTAHVPHRSLPFSTSMNLKVPYVAEATSFLERNPVIAIVLTLIMLRSIRALSNRLLEYARKK
jgi:hypothetical protein